MVVKIEQMAWIELRIREQGTAKYRYICPGPVVIEMWISCPYRCAANISNGNDVILMVRIIRINILTDFLIPGQSIGMCQ